MMPPIFMISFDCEGKWGLADNIDEIHDSAITNENLNIVYQRLIKILNRYEIKGTFAFVGAFTMSIAEYHAHKDWFLDVCIDGKAWNQIFKQHASNKLFDGWLNPEAFKIVESESTHEIAAHGFSHLLLSESIIERSDFIEEMRLLKQVSAFTGRELKTFIYPRNQIGYIDELQKAGFLGYREAYMSHFLSNNPMGQFVKRLERLATEFNVFAKAQNHSHADRLVAIPSGRFLNWRSGLRNKIPRSLTIKRWNHIINEAIHNNKVVHLYTHPHNFITGDHMFELLEAILKLISEAKNNKEINNLTQEEYVELILKSQLN